MLRTSLASDTKSVKEIKVSLKMLFVMFMLSIISLQAFLYQFVGIGNIIDAGENASFMTTLPPIFMGVAAFVYASLADFVSIRKIFVTGFIIFMFGSLFGCVTGYLAPLHAKLTYVVLSRCIQAFGGQVSGSCFLVLVGRYLKGKERVIFYGIFSASFQLGIGLGALASGVLVQPGIWPLLFVIPCISIFLFWPCYKNMPGLVEGVEETRGHIDVFGFSIFTIFSGFLITFISIPAYTWALFGSLAALALFIVWICKGKHPFITPNFFTNVRWILAASSLFIIWFTAYAILPLVRETAGTVFLTINDALMAVWLLIPIMVAVVLGVVSGSIADKIGRMWAIVLGIAFELIGYVGSALVLGAVNIFWFMFFLAFYWGGYAFLYSPLVDAVISTVRPAEMGRGFGMNDLIIALSPSIGMALFSPMIRGAEPVRFFPNSSPFVSQFASTFLLCAIPALIGVLFYLISRRKTESTQ